MEVCVKQMVPELQSVLHLQQSYIRLFQLQLKISFTHTVNLLQGLHTKAAVYSRIC